MNDNALLLGRVRGIRILVHWSWIFLLVTWSLATAYLPHHFPAWPVSESWLVGAAAALLLFLSVLVHEVSHSITAQRYGVKVESITLYLFGGASDIATDMRSPRQEFWIVAAGPLSSLVLAAVFLAAHLLTPHPDWMAAILGYLGLINGLLAAFNLVPAFPLDGGRILHSLVWKVTGDQTKALRVSTTVGGWMAWAFILIGIWDAFAGDLVGGIWLVLIGWFLHNASAAAMISSQGTASWGHLTAADIMTKVRPITSDDRLDRVVHQILQQDERALPVVDGDSFRGLLTVENIRQFEPEQWPVTAAYRAMTPVGELGSVTPELGSAAVLALLAHDRPVLPVLQDGRLIGLVSRTGVAEYLRLRHDLGLDSPRSTSGSPAGAGKLGR